MKTWIVLVWFSVLTPEHGLIDTIPIPLLYEYSSRDECEQHLPELLKPTHQDPPDAMKKVRCIPIPEP